ncbi:secreted RxLR effector peptide protein, putative [Phytophthora infestans T30-4]|uniref:Secreted RxLR effector peptide protein, putative n=1 Tax=Phytophthora infestans (strain T30-4) TaxID=403677 RepID=D0NDK3_PHYIT|nr:secreted RxLR effector peptide protein, putative [Phytophthora infestans T30-4]EEY56160.1 secreted RxLR effector peptide protein, putative [Phytophthora infestans T30-4]|eukprot:XP_002902990.1 secreted RxLR effector peptide protein, putative [Phytophthora infestans T30-4]
MGFSSLLLALFASILFVHGGTISANAATNQAIEGFGSDNQEERALNLESLKKLIPGSSALQKAKTLRVVKKAEELAKKKAAVDKWLQKFQMVIIYSTSRSRRGRKKRCHPQMCTECLRKKARLEKRSTRSPLVSTIIAWFKCVHRGRDTSSRTDANTASSQDSNRSSLSDWTVGGNDYRLFLLTTLLPLQTSIERTFLRCSN